MQAWSAGTTSASTATQSTLKMKFPKALIVLIHLAHKAVANYSSQISYTPNYAIKKHLKSTVNTSKLPM